MTRARSFSLSLRRTVAMGVASLLLMVVFSWPLARYARTGIAHTAFNLAPGEPMSMVPGDHLQFLYHLWLAQDTFAGHTPAFHNLYEFNTGDDAGRRDVTPYYLPFSAFFAAASIPFGQAAGWNFAGVMSTRPSRPSTPSRNCRAWVSSPISSSCVRSATLMTICA